MSYTSQTWTDNDPTTPVSAARLAHIESGLATVANGGSQTVLGTPSGTDDTTTIQTAIDSTATAGGGKVIVPVGGWIASQLKLKSNVTIEGVGWGSIITQKASTNGHLFSLNDGNVQRTVVRNIRLSGNKGAQGVNQNDCLHYDNTGFTDTLSADPHHVVHDVMIDSFSGNGVWLGTKASECRFRNVYVESVALAGFYINWADNFFTDCTAAVSGQAGFHLTSSGTNCRLTSCKAFYNGASMAATTDRGEGFYLAGGSNELTGCEAQDNYGHGFTLDTINDTTLASCLSDSNGQYAPLTTAAGFNLINIQRCQLTGFQAFNRGAFTRQQYGIYGGTTFAGHNNRLHGACNGNNTLPINIWSEESGSNNDVRLNSYGGMQQGSGNVGAGDCLQGDQLLWSLNQNVSIAHLSNRWTGVKFTYTFIQDSTGGRTVSWDSRYNTTFVPDKRPSAVSSITFVFDGLNYQPVAMSPIIDRRTYALTSRAIISESDNPAAYGSSTVATTGSWFGSLVGLAKGDVITSIGVEVVTNGSTLSLAKVGIWSSAGTLLAASSDASSSFTSGAVARSQAVSLSAPYTILADDGYYLGIICVGTTGPALTRGSGQSSVKYNSGSYAYAAAIAQTDAATVTPASSSLAFYFCCF